jgi:uncharacterized protein YdcH (DUF465 family)
MYVPVNAHFTNLFEEANSINEFIDRPGETGTWFIDRPG